MTAEVETPASLKLSPELSKRLVDDLGGTNAVARIFEISPPSVTGWRQIGIPAKRLIALRKIARAKPNGVVWRALVNAGVNPRGPLADCITAETAAATGRMSAPGVE